MAGHLTGDLKANSRLVGNSASTFFAEAELYAKQRIRKVTDE